MAIRIRGFIPYEPKLTILKHNNKPLCKNLPKEFSTVDNSRQIERNPVPIRVSTIDALLMQRVNREGGITVEGMPVQPILLCQILMQVESLTEVYKGIDNEDSDDSEFPSVPEIESNYRKKQRAKQDLRRGYASEAVDKPALDKGGHFINSDKSILRINFGDSQGESGNPSLLWISSLTMHR